MGDTQAAYNGMRKGTDREEQKIKLQKVHKRNL